MKQNKTSNLCPTVVQGALQQYETPISQVCILRHLQKHEIIKCESINVGCI